MGGEVFFGETQLQMGLLVTDFSWKWNVWLIFCVKNERGGWFLVKHGSFGRFLWKMKDRVAKEISENERQKADLKWEWKAKGSVARVLKKWSRVFGTRLCYSIFYGTFEPTYYCQYFLKTHYLKMKFFFEREIKE